MAGMGNNCMDNNCLICTSPFTAAPFRVVEMMFGTQEPFDYAMCPECASLQICDTPTDLGRYYCGDGYYSYQAAYASGLKGRMRRMRDASYFGGGGPLGRLMARCQPALLMQVLAEAGLTRDQRILDVGCGAGLLLDRLALIGFRQLSGVDPFIPDEVRTPAGVIVRKTRFNEIAAPQDVIMFHHSLEHVPDPAAELRHAATLLKDGGRCIVRVPTPSSSIWKNYGVHWVQLDAPRHIFLPSRTGIARLAVRTGFILEKVIDDSWAFGFWGSELYRRGIALHGPEGAVDPSDHFEAKQIAEWAKMATNLNASGEGDQVAFVLRAIN